MFESLNKPIGIQVAVFLMFFFLGVWKAIEIIIYIFKHISWR